jgi:hypothetical protein
MAEDGHVGVQQLTEKVEEVAGVPALLTAQWIGLCPNCYGVTRVRKDASDKCFHCGFSLNSDHHKFFVPVSLWEAVVPFVNQLGWPWDAVGGTVSVEDLAAPSTK